MLISAANRVASDLFAEAGRDPSKVNSSFYTDRVVPQSETIQPDDLVVIFESFDNLNFCYAKPGEIFSNRNGHFHHSDFIGKPYGCKVRSRDNRGYGYMYLLKPTPELWARSLNHRTQIVHELDASMIVYYLNLRPNMVVCESGTGSGALSHCILRTIAPHGRLHTFEFNEVRAEAARKEFEKNRVDHLVTVHHKDVCGKKEDSLGGFDQPQASVDAITLDLPEPWRAVPRAAYCLKSNARIASYSPCVEQSQRTILALQQAGFHSIQTMEFRLREHCKFTNKPYTWMLFISNSAAPHVDVDEVDYEFAPKDKRPRLVGNPYVGDGSQNVSGGEDTGAEADNEKSEYETEDQASLAGVISHEEVDGDDANETKMGTATQTITDGGTSILPPSAAVGTNNVGGSAGTPKRKKMLVARPFGMMKGHTAFLTFASAGNKKQHEVTISHSLRNEDLEGNFHG
jgi:tRNA (adenine57-N1/adenine58-N1)-methyltransferase